MENVKLNLNIVCLQATTILVTLIIFFIQFKASQTKIM